MATTYNDRPSEFVVAIPSAVNQNNHTFENANK